MGPLQTKVLWKRVRKVPKLILCVTMTRVVRMKLCDEKKQRSKRQENGKRYEQKKVAKFMLKEREGIKEEHVSILHEINLHKVVALIVMHCQTVNKVQRKDRQIQTGSTWCPRRT